MKLYKYVKGTNFVFALTDAEGTVLDYVGDDQAIQSRTKKSGLTVGVNRSEKYAGTCGIGTCLATGQPVQIWGEEHYIKPHHNYICSAAPIHDSFGNLIGCLDAVGPREISPIHTLAMVNASVDGIEKELKITEAYDRVNLAHKQMSSTLQAIGSGILMIDNNGVITQHNSKSIKMLRLNVSSLNGSSLSDFIKLSSCNPNLLNIENEVFDTELSFINHSGVMVSLSLSATLVHNQLGQKIGTVIVLDEIKHVHKLVNKMSGFTAKYTFDSIIGASDAMESVKSLGNSAAQSSSTVLILGESGTGKELLAQAIHNASDRKNYPFIAINCGSLPKGLIESELFGYDKGAFTGANKEGHPGKFELADGGTLFLDEIGDMPLELQTTLLRVLQNREIVRIGGTHPKQIDVRIIAATNVDLLNLVNDKRFRNDLYYRLNVLSIQVPPLRTRIGDISILVNHFITFISKKLSKSIYSIDDTAMLLLLNYLWPGNVRELENVIERAVNVTNSGVIHVEDLPNEVTSSSTFNSNYSLTALSSNSNELVSENKKPLIVSGDSRTEKTIELIISTLKAENGNISKVSEKLGIPRRTLYRKLEKYNINADNYRFL
jgi:transcriptional regulator with PAS, ATPase and Fis domain